MITITVLLIPLPSVRNLNRKHAQIYDKYCWVKNCHFALKCKEKCSFFNPTFDGLVFKIYWGNSTNHPPSQLQTCLVWCIDKHFCCIQNPCPESNTIVQPEQTFTAHFNVAEHYLYSHDKTV